MDSIFDNMQDQPASTSSAPTSGNNGSIFTGIQDTSNDPLSANYEHNKSYATPGPYFTKLNNGQEVNFRKWLKTNKVDFDPNANITDYDMRGYWLSLQNGVGQSTQTNQYDGKLHYPDTYKTPYDRDFSNESKYALKNAPHWVGDRYLVDSKGNVIFDQKTQTEDSPWKNSGSIFAGMQNTPQTPDEDTSKQQSSLAMYGHKIAQALHYVDTQGQLSDQDLHNFGQDIKNAGLSAWEYLRNFRQAHETFNAGKVTLQERGAARLLGMNNPAEALDPYSFSTPSPTEHGQVYKLSPQEREDLYNKFLSEHGGTPTQEESRIEGTLSGDPNKFDPMAPLLGSNHVADLLLYPHLSNTERYYLLQSTVHDMDVVENPNKYSKEQVQESAAHIEALKKNRETSDWQEIKKTAKEVVKSPGRTALALLGNFMQTPELALAPEAEVGDLLLGSRIAKTAKGIKEAEETAKTASTISKAAAGGASDVAKQAAQKSAAYADVYGRVASKQKAFLHDLESAKRITNTLGKIGAGAAVNVGTAEAHNLSTIGYNPKGSLITPAIAGAAFGAVGHGMQRLTEAGETDVGDVARDMEGASRETAQLRQGEKGTITEPHQPGQPIPTDAPINDSGTIPYTGGASTDLKETHIDKNFPTELPIKNRAGQTLTVPVKDIVAKVHEAEEAPLMHPKQPLTIQQLRDIIGRAGKYATNKIFSPAVRRKIIAGEPLTYPEAHEIATAIENNHVDNTYNIDPKVYQSAMKPYIKDIADRSEEEPKSDIPASLDTKPYDDMDHPEVVYGQAKPSSYRNITGNKVVQLAQKQAIEKTGHIVAHSPQEQAEQNVKDAEAKMNLQSGAISPEMRKLMAAGTLGVLGGTYGYAHNQQHPIKGAMEGAAAAIAIGRLPWLRMYPAIKKAWQVNNNIAVHDLLNTWDYRQAAAERVTTQLQDNIRSLIPNKDSQVKITHYLEGDKSIKLTPQEQKAAQIARNYYDHMAETGIREGILGDVQLNYVNHEWRNQEQVKTVLDKLAQDPKYANMSPEDRHAMARSIVTIAKGKQLGLTPRTENIVDLIGIYSKSMNKALANKELLVGLKNKVMSNGVKAVMPSGKAPKNYVAINHPQLNGLRVDPSIAPSLGFLFKTVGNSGVDIFNTALKREETGLSLFHPVALINAFLTANDLHHPIRNLVDIATSAAGKGRAHKMYQTGGQGDLMDLALQSGLKITPRQGEVTDEDVNTQFYEGLHRAQDFADHMVPGTGLLVKGYEKLNKASDRFVWENVHTGLKGITFMNAYEKLKTNWAAAKEHDPTTQVPSDLELARQASSFTNDTFGGLNWRRIADDATTHVGRMLGLAMASPGSRRAAQLLMFAPDWTYSTVRSFLMASQRGTGLKGLLKPRTLADLHRQYIMRNAILYFTLYDGLNVALSGHHIWENKKYGGDMFMLDLGDGRHMAINKHAYEVPHAVENPAKFALGKMGILPSEALDQLLGKEYLTPTGGPPMKEGRVMHAAKRLEPFSLNAMIEQGPEGVWSNLAGLPIYGRKIGRENYQRYENQMEQRQAQNDNGEQ